MGDNGKDQNIIKTIHGIGFKFLPAVEYIEPQKIETLADITTNEPTGLEAIPTLEHLDPESVYSTTPKSSLAAKINQLITHPLSLRLVAPLIIMSFIFGTLQARSAMIAPQTIPPLAAMEIIPEDDITYVLSDTAKMAFARAEKLAQSENQLALRESIEQYNLAIQNAPDYPYAYLGRSKARRHLYSFDTLPYDDTVKLVRSDIMRAQALAPNLSDIHIASAGLALFEDNYADAITLSDIAIDRLPNRAEPYFLKAKALFKLRRYEEAETTYLEALPHDPTSAVILNDLANLKLLQGDEKAAINYAKLNAKWNPQSATALDMLAYAYIGEPEKAFETLSERLDGLDDQEILFLTGNFKKSAELMVDEMHDMHMLGPEPIARGDGNLYVEACFLLQYARHADAEKICEKTASFFQAQSPSNHFTNSDIESGAAWYSLIEDNEKSAKWLSYLADRGHAFSSIDTSQLFESLRKSTIYKDIHHRNLTNAAMHLTDISLPDIQSLR